MADCIGLNLKPYEITASGACLLCDRRPGFDEVFEEGVEAVGFADPAEARRRAGELIADPARARRIAEAGRARTLRDHTWTSAAPELVNFALDGQQAMRRAA